ncbi:MAG: cupin domain-containing protein [Burkholderiales bacterium]|nr:cupin domain-containing protein [Burkholderiales bacterium]
MTATTLVHVDEVAPENMRAGEGWAISEFRLPISGKHGSASTVFHSIFRPGSTHAKHLHSRCDEIAVYLRGRGVVGQGDERTEVRPGHCRLMPRGSEHFFFNETEDEEALVVGFYVGAKSVEDTGYAFRGNVTAADTAMPRAAGLRHGILVHVDAVKPMRTGLGFQADGVDLRFPIGRHNGADHALFWLTLAPGATYPVHRHERCEKVYYVIRGHALAGVGQDRVEIRAGHVHLISRGVEHSLANTSASEPLELIGVYTGAGSLEESGYLRQQ